ncbi:MAG: VOC family protein [Acidimicrobiales bacterium]|nr:VOC family protein [Acidimicrobiales bacterium]
MSAIVNHVGLAVSDLAASRRFYEEVFGFEFKNEATFPDAATTKLFAMDGPLGLHVVYLQRDGWVLELLGFDDTSTAPRRERAMNEPGLTHLSICVDDVAAACAAAVALGGLHLPEQGFTGLVEMVRDPDGQLIEVLPMGYRDGL